MQTVRIMQTKEIIIRSISFGLLFFLMSLLFMYWDSGELRWIPSIVGCITGTIAFFILTKRQMKRRIQTFNQNKK
jgi:membrane associated rhomboid family serine protease